MRKIILITASTILFLQTTLTAGIHGFRYEDKKEKKVEKADTVKKESEYDKLIKQGGSEKKGLFNVRHIKKDWYFEVHDSVMGRLILAVTRFKAVPQGFKMLSGEEVNRSVVYFEQYDEKTIFLREYVQSQFAEENSRLGIALKESTVDPIIYKFDVIGRNKEGNAQLINISKLILADNKLCGFTQKDRSIINVSSLVAERSMVDTIKTYPINTEVITLRTYNMSSGKLPAAETGSATLKLNTSFIMLPKEPMRARLADERVGFFQNACTYFSDDQQVTKHEAIIQRYRLEPKDIKKYMRGELTEPVKPIIYYIDPATPKKWVPYLIKGIEDWNKAFEAAGFKNAIKGKEWPKGTDMDLDDARICVLRYLPSESENAYGPRIVDPRSGEIIESHICWYHNVMNLLKKWYMIQCGPLDKRAQSMNFDDELMGNLIRFVSSHEVGHTLGLRHNMVASSATPVEKLRDKKWVEANGHTVSIMDYARFNYVAQPEDNISPEGLFPRIGEYDKWVISWGYRYRPNFKDIYEEKKALRTEVTRKLKEDKRMWFLGDEGKGADPRSQSEDLGDNNMKANEYGIKNLKRVVDNICRWTAQADGENNELESMYKSIRSQFTKYMLHVQKNIGGRYTNNGNSDKKYDYVPRLMQKEAIEWMGRNVLTAPLWLYPDEIINKVDVKVTNEISDRQYSLVAYLLAAGMLNNIYNASLYSDDPYNVDEYLDDVFAAIWKPFSKTNEKENIFRKQLELNYLFFLDKLLNPDEKDTMNSKKLVGQTDIIVYVEMHLDKMEKFAKDKIASCQKDDKNYKYYDVVARKIKKMKDNYYKD